ncbi:MAG: recombinase family protein [Bacteroidota bacterium]
MNYAYLRVSTDKQDVENQKVGILEYATARNIQVDEFVEDVVSGTKDWQKRALGNIIESAKAGDVLIFAEVSRIARSTLQCLQVLQVAADKKLTVHVAKQQMIFDNSLNSKIIATTLSLASEIERTFISMRTKEALKKAKANGKVLSRPKGKQSTNAILAANHDHIASLLKDKVSVSAIGRMMKVDRKTVSRYIERHLPQYAKTSK